MSRQTPSWLNSHNQDLSIALLTLASGVLLDLIGCSPRKPGSSTWQSEWSAYGHDAAGTRHSPLAQITPTNIETLKEAWTYRTGDLLADRGRFESTPLYVDGTLFVATHLGRIIALDPVTGAERWVFDARVDLSGNYGDFATRGLSTWVDTARVADGPCRRRLFLATVDARLLAVDARTGQACADFGASGAVDLSAGVRNAPQFKGEFQVTSPGAVVGGLVIVGNAIADNQRIDAPAGVVRAYDARTGSLRWSWDPVPQSSDDKGFASWRGTRAHTTGAANAWSAISADTMRGLVFVPTGSPSPDFYGGERLGENLYANSIVALRATTGEVVWHFQVVHHDLWDYDVATQPLLFTMHRNGSEIPAVAVGTKMGHIFILNRETGEPLFPVVERPVPRSSVAGEEAWPTQPFPSKPAPIGARRLTADGVWGINRQDRESCRERLSAFRNEGIFTPPSSQGTIIFPGNIGGANWSGMSLDSARGLLVVPTNSVAFVVTLIPRASLAKARHEHPRDEISDQSGAPYGMSRVVLLGPSALPCNPPPWGQLTAIDLSTGDVKWQRSFGVVPALESLPNAFQWGSFALGGVMSTAGGVLFATGGIDERLWAFDVESGRELARLKLPAGGNALPMTYEGPDGKQYVVIAAGGHDRLGTRLGDFVIAYSLTGKAKAAPNETLLPLASHWKGEFRDRDRLVATLDLVPSGRAGYFSGQFSIENSEVTGTASVERTGNDLSLRIAFTNPARKCQGKLAGQGSLANAGALFVGTVAETGGCTERQNSRKSFALRPVR